MAIDAVDGALTSVRWQLGSGQKRYLWLGIGALTSVFAVGGRWDIALAAWVSSIFLLRFSRSSRLGVAIFFVWLVRFCGPIMWMWELAVPIQLSTIVSCALFGVIFSLPYIVDRLLTPRLGFAGRLLLFPAMIVVCEFGMGVFSPLGTAYGVMAVTQYANLPLLQVISITGPYGIGFLIGGLATVVNFLWEDVSAPKARWSFAIYAVVLAAVLIGGSLRLSFFPPVTTYVRIGGVAPSPVPKGAQVDANAVRGELFAKTEQAAQAGAQVVVWSENAVVLSTADRPAFLSQAAQTARRLKIYLDVADNVPKLKDETHMFGPSGAELWTYEKAHPIPGMEPYAPGDRKVPVINTPFGRIANVICYDADFPALFTGVDADIMLVPGGDWPEMGRTHTLHMASLRAIENGFSLFRQDVNGLSAAFDYQGHVLGMQDTTPKGQHLLMVEVPTRGVTTIYRVIGDVFAWLCVVGSLVMIAFGLLGRRAKA